MNTVSFRVDGPDQAGEARRAATAMAAALGFGAEDTGRVAIVVSEFASNLWKHAAGGEILVSDPSFEGEPCIEALGLDRGPGMLDVTRCFQDGYSTAGSQGAGLGAIERLSHCEVFTQPGKGTAILARILKRGREAARGEPFASGGVSVPLAGETVCGDGYALRQTGACLLAMMVDGLGHGLLAAECAARAIEAFQQSREQAPAKLVREIHGALRGTRGGAVSVARLDPSAREIYFAGAGNVLGMVTNPAGQSKNFIAMPGIVGHNIPSVKEFTYSWPGNGVVLLYSDGISSHWSLDDYPGLAFRDPSLISGVIYRDRKRGRDDASVLAIRERSST